MNKKRYFGIAVFSVLPIFPVLTILTILLALTGCNNFFHELVPPDENRIRSFSLPGQLGPAQIGETTIHVTVGPGTDIGSLLPSASIPAKATLLPVTLPYIQKAFPSVSLFREAMNLYAAQDRANYVIDLIRDNRDFTVPALDEAIDFSGPVTFLVVSGLGTIRQYTVTVEVDTAEGKFLSFEFSKYHNPDLTKGDAIGTINNTAKTIDIEVWYPVENIGSYTVVPSFETNGAAVSLEGAELTDGKSDIAFTKPASQGWSTVTEAKTLTIQRPGFAPADYTLTVTFREDMDTIRSITDFRFNENINYGIRYTAVGEISDTGNTGTITVQVHHSGAPPASLTPSFVSPGTVSVGGTDQMNGLDSHDFTQPVEYKVVSKDTMYTRIYQVTVEFVNEEDARPRIQSFGFYRDDNPALGANTEAMIDHGAGIIVIEAVYTADPQPDTLVPRFSAGGMVSVTGMPQTSGVTAQDFSHMVKYTVRNPLNPTLFREYRVETRFVKESLSLAEIGEFWFFTEDNPELCANVAAVIDQEAGTIYAVLPFDTLGNGHRTLYPKWQAQGTVEAGGVVLTSGEDGRVFSPPVVYRAISADRVFQKDYTVKVLEVNTRIYVDRDATTGDNTGVSWGNAFKSLGEACEAAMHLPEGLPAEIWIAEGSYRPSETGDKAAYFPVRGNTGYYGGFAGTETALTQRVPGANPVILSGDLGGGEYSEHLFMNAGAEDFYTDPGMEGRNAAFGEMTFTRAKTPTALLLGTNRSGTAIYLRNPGAVTIRNAVFEDLQAGSAGGAVYASSNFGSSFDISVTLTGCRFENIQAGGNGGAVFVSNSTSGGSVTITDCNFENTQAESGGGAVYVISSISSGSIAVTITGCHFENTQAKAGGAAYARSENGSVTITGCEFENTQAASDGGAVYAHSSNDVTITDCDFENTQAAGGGAIYASSGSVSITDCGFTDTQANNFGGAVQTSNSSSVTIMGCDFENTQANNYYGGAVYVSGSSSITITDCDFTDTQAGRYGGAVYAYGGSVSSITITDCDFTDIQAGNSDNTGYSLGGSLYLAGDTIGVTDVKITNSTAGLSNDGYYGRGGGIYINRGTAALSGVHFTNVKALGDTTGGTIGGAVFFSTGTALTITDCFITGAISNERGGAVGGCGPSSCTLSGVAFAGCSAPLGSLLFGNKYIDIDGAPAYTVGPGCSVDGIPIPAAAWSSLPDEYVYLNNGASIEPEL